MAKILLTSCGTLGDHFPFLALGTGLAARGHEVIFAGPSYLREHAVSCGLEHRTCRPEFSPDDARREAHVFDHWKSPRAEEVDLFKELETEARVEDLRRAAEDMDLLIVSRIQPVGRLLHDLLGIPWITACVTPWLYPAANSAAHKGLAAQETHEVLAGPSANFIQQLNGLRARLGLREIPPENASDHFEAERVLLASSPHFGIPESIEGRELVQTGFWLHDPPAWRSHEPAADLLEWVERTEPLVLSFSSQPLADPGEVFRCHAEAARLLGKTLVVQSGWAGFADENGAAHIRMLPEGPQDWLFARAAAVIHHGGIGTTARVLRAGAPALVEPYGNDQFYNARQILALGAGTAVNPHRATPEGLARVLRDKVFPAKPRAQALGAELRETNPVDLAVDQIENWF